MNSHLNAEQIGQASANDVLEQLGEMSEAEHQYYLKKHFEIRLEIDDNNQHYTKVKCPEHLKKIIDG